jgi:hypothetical protein
VLAAPSAPNNALSCPAPDYRAAAASATPNNAARDGDRPSRARTARTAQVREGNYFGEYTLLTGEKRFYNAVAGAPPRAGRTASHLWQ